MVPLIIDVGGDGKAVVVVYGKNEYPYVARHDCTKVGTRTKDTACSKYSYSGGCICMLQVDNSGDRMKTTNLTFVPPVFVDVFRKAHINILAVI